MICSTPASTPSQPLALVAIVGTAEIFQSLEHSCGQELAYHFGRRLLRLFVFGEPSTEPRVERTGFRMVGKCAIDVADDNIVASRLVNIIDQFTNEEAGPGAATWQLDGTIQHRVQWLVDGCGVPQLSRLCAFRREQLSTKQECQWYCRSEQHVLCPGLRRARQIGVQHA